MEEDEKEDHGYNNLVLCRDRPSIIWWLLQEAGSQERKSFFEVADRILEAHKHSVVKASVSQQVCNRNSRRSERRDRLVLDPQFLFCLMDGSPIHSCDPGPIAIMCAVLVCVLYPNVMWHLKLQLESGILSRRLSLLNLMRRIGGHSVAAETKKPHLEEEQAGPPSCK